MQGHPAQCTTLKAKSIFILSPETQDSEWQLIRNYVKAIVYKHIDNPSHSGWIWREDIVQEVMMSLIKRAYKEGGPWEVNKAYVRRRTIDKIKKISYSLHKKKENEAIYAAQRRP